MKEIELTRGYKTMVDDEDYDRLCQYKWHVGIRQDRRYACTSKNLLKGVLRTTEMQRMVMNAEDGDIIDHRDRDGLNNQKSNLRKCTKAQNGYNSKKHNRGTSRFKGVSLFPHTLNILATGERKIGDRAKPYCAEIRVDKKRISLGYYRTDVEAAIAYNDAAKKYHGEFARLNILDDLLVQDK